MCKKPAAQTCDGIVSVTPQIKPVTGGGGMSEEEALQILGDSKLRRAAYGRLETAVYNTDDKAVVPIYEGLSKVRACQDEKKKEFLKQWLMDPGFSTCIAICGVYVEHLNESESAERIVTEWKLQQLEGVEDAKFLIDNNLLQPGVDRYGRSGWVYSEDVVRRIRKGKMKVGMKQTMQLDASQAQDMQASLLDADVWSTGAGGLNKLKNKGKGQGKGKGKGKGKGEPKEISPEEKQAKELVVAVRAIEKQLTKTRTSVLVHCQQSAKSKNSIVKSILKKKDGWLKKLSTHQLSIDGMATDKVSNPKDVSARNKKISEISDFNKAVSRDIDCMVMYT